MAAIAWLIPVPLGASSPIEQVLPSSTLIQIDPIRHFVVETPKVARAFLKPIINGALAERHWYELNQRTIEPEFAAMLAPLKAGQDIGILSDAGCPGIADPGAQLVAKIHDEIAAGANFKVRPLIGPTSIIMALMASGMNGQQFAFVGYLPSDAEGRKKSLLALQARSQKNRESILMIETPYRSKAFLQTALDCLAPQTRLMSASQLSLVDEMIVSQSVAQWRRRSVAQSVSQQLAEPTVFALLAST
jgi:16S rRNA (cytidine1402-2'-O)-methyltransferase